MILVLVLLFFIFTASSVRFSVVKLAEPAAVWAHRMCLENLPPNSIHLPELKALVCAENFTGLHQSELYAASGLIHLFVVSGSHLLLLERAFSFFIGHNRQLKFLLYPLLIFYALMCSLSPPLVRCLAGFALSELLYERNVEWPAHFRLLIVGLLTLLLNPLWVDSLSLQLSWLAAFVVAVQFKNSDVESYFSRQLLFFFLLAPTVIFFQISSLTHLLTNLLLAPLTEFLLFPLALSSWLFNFLSPLFDFCMGTVKLILQNLEFSVRLQNTSLPEQIKFFNWMLILALHLISHLHSVQQKRKSLREYEKDI